MSKRRTGMRGARLRRMRQAAAALGIAAVLSALGYLAVREAADPRFALGTIVVTGAEQTTAAEVASAAAFPAGGDIWFLDIAGARRRIAALPWVASADVSRAWPNGVTVTIHERRPAAVVSVGAGGNGEEPAQQIALVDAGMRVLAVVPADALPPSATGLPTVRVSPAPNSLRPGDSAAGTDIERAYDALIELRALGLDAVEVALAPATGVEVTRTDGLHIMFGSDDAFAQKVVVLGAIAPKIASPRDVVYVDLRSPHAPTVLYR